MEPQLHCNACSVEFKPGDRAIATQCCHLFCFDCTKRCLTTDSSCVVCNEVVTKSTIKAITVLNPPNDPSFKLLLAGQHPASALNSALSSIEQYVHQQNMYAEKKVQHLEQKNIKMADNCRAKLGELHKAYAAAKRKYDDMKNQNQLLEADNRELQDKYAQKAMEAKKLRENVQLLMTTKDELQRTCEQLSRRGGGGGGNAAAAGPTPTIYQQQNRTHNNTMTNMNDKYGSGGSGGMMTRPASADVGGGSLYGGGGTGGTNGMLVRSNSALGIVGGGAQRGVVAGGGRIFPQSSPLTSPAYNPNAMKFDFQTPAVPPQQPRGPAQYSGPISGSGFHAPPPPTSTHHHPNNSARHYQPARSGGGNGGNLGQQQYPGSSRPVGGRVTPQYSGGGHQRQQQQPAMSGLGLTGISGFDI